MAEEEFEHLVEYLDLLVRDFERLEADFLGRLPWTEQTAADPGAVPPPPAEERAHAEAAGAADARRGA